MEEQAPRSPAVSWDILAREPVANEAEVKHILIGWSGLEGGGDPRAAARSQQQAEQEVAAILEKLQAGEKFEKAMATFSEDQGSAASGQSFHVSPSAGLVIEFKQLSSRLDVGEIGVCQSQFGFHIIKRVK